MKAYLAITASLFGLIAIAHIWRVIAESASLARDPWFVLLTAIAALLCVWGCRLFLATPPRRDAGAP